MLDRCVVHHHVKDNSQAASMDLFDQLQNIIHAAVFGSDVSVVRNIVTEISLRGSKERRDPDGFKSQALNVVQFSDDALEVADPIPITIIKRTRVDLVD